MLLISCNRCCENAVMPDLICAECTLFCNQPESETMSDLYSNDKVRARAEGLVNTDVLYCVSTLISSLAKAGDVALQALDLDYENDLMPVLEVDDFEAAGANHISGEMGEDELREYLSDNDVEFIAPVDEDDATTDNPATEGTSVEALRQLALEFVEGEHEGWKTFCDEMNLDPERLEVYEHWIVTGWLAGKLTDKGHVVAEILGMTIWGRPTTGQAISMDSVMLEIANDLEKL